MNPFKYKPCLSYYKCNDSKFFGVLQAQPIQNKRSRIGIIVQKEKKVGKFVLQHMNSLFSKLDNVRKKKKRKKTANCCTVQSLIVNINDHSSHLLVKHRNMNKFHF